MYTWLHTLLHEKHVDTCFPLTDILTSSGQRLASGAMSRTAVSFCCAVVKENGVHNEFVDQLDDDELRNGYFQQDGATFHTSNESMTEIGSFYWWPDYFESLMAAKISWLKSARFFPVRRLKRKSLCQQATHHTGTGKQHSTWNCCD